MNPTHVLSVSTIKDEMKPFYKQLNMKGYFYDYDSLDGMEKSITELGKQFNREKKAKELNHHLNSVKANIESKVAKQKKHPKVLILMGIPGSYLVATDKSYIEISKSLVERMSYKTILNSIFLLTRNI